MTDHPWDDDEFCIILSLNSPYVVTKRLYFFTAPEANKNSVAFSSTQDSTWELRMCVYVHYNTNIFQTNDKKLSSAKLRLSLKFIQYTVIFQIIKSNVDYCCKQKNQTIKFSSKNIYWASEVSQRLSRCDSTDNSLGAFLDSHTIRLYRLSAWMSGSALRPRVLICYF